MMSIDIQIKSLLFSFFFGVFFSFVLRLNYKYMYSNSLILKIIMNFVFVLDSVLLYFIALKKLNEGIVHSYFLIMILLGFVTMEVVFKRLRFDFNLKK